MPCRQHGELSGTRDVERIGRYDHCAGAFLRERRKRCVDLMRRASFQDKETSSERTGAVVGRALVEPCFRIVGLTSRALSAAWGKSSFSTSMCLFPSSPHNHLTP